MTINHTVNTNSDFKLNKFVDLTQVIITSTENKTQFTHLDVVLQCIVDTESFTARFYLNIVQIQAVWDFSQILTFYSYECKYGSVRPKDDCHYGLNRMITFVPPTLKTL